MEKKEEEDEKAMNKRKKEKRKEKEKEEEDIKRIEKKYGGNNDGRVDHHYGPTDIIKDEHIQRKLRKKANLRTERGPQLRFWILIPGSTDCEGMKNGQTDGWHDRQTS